MKIDKNIKVGFMACILISITALSNFLLANQKSFNQKETEQYLKRARIESDWKPSGTRGDSYFVNLDDRGIKKRGFLKFTNNLRPKVPTDSYIYGLAAYELDKLLDLNIYPPVVERRVNGRKASLQILINRYLDEDERKLKDITPPDPKKFFNALEEIKIFEYLVYDTALCLQTDPQDVLITEEWKVWRVDLSEAFRPSPELIKGCEITRCSRKLYQNLQQTEDKKIRSKLKKYLNEDEMSALLKRKNIIIEILQKLIKEKGEEVVLFE
ncbi:MAG: hypothetical protein OEY25_13485 [Candidatus Aminicenantes bacterium]|nr:hypothetical protein [Candidatus Aminicenantes bacterium]MDH5706497.1 hypothetical protein [Candidatus Aminicenantes bacterium]